MNVYHALTMMVLAVINAPSTAYSSLPDECRVAILINELVDHEPSRWGQVKTHFIEHISRYPYISIIDMDHSTKGSLRYGEPSQIEIKLPELLRQVNADMLIFATVSFSKASADNVVPHSNRAYTYQGTADLQFVTDTSHRISRPIKSRTLGSHKQSYSHALPFAVRNVSKDLLSEVSPHIQKSCSPQKSYKITAHLTGSVNPRKIEKFVSAFRKMDGVDHAQVEFSSPKTLILHIKSVRSKEAIARSLQRLRPGIYIHSISEQGIMGYVTLGRLALIELTAIPFSTQSPIDREQLGSLAKTFPLQIVSSLRKMDIVRDSSAKTLGTLSAIKRRSRRNKVLFVMAGRVSQEKEDLIVQIRIKRPKGKDSRPLTTTTRCPRSQPFLCASQAVEDIKPVLYQKLEDMRDKLPGYLPPMPEHHLSLEIIPKSPVLFSSVDIDPLSSIYPSMIYHYTQLPAGTLTIRNQSHQDLNNIHITATLPGLSRGPTQVSIPRLRSRERKQIVIHLDLDQDKMRSLTKAHNRDLLLKMSYRSTSTTAVEYFERSHYISMRIQDPAVLHPKYSYNLSAR